jgi:type I restriction enzyme S subunit
MTFPRYPEYKDSGFEWLGTIPTHWGVHALKYSAKEFYSGGTPESGNESYWTDDGEGSISWVAISDMTRATVIESTEKKITPEALLSKGLRVLPPGTLLYSMYASLGKVAVLGIPAAINQAILAIVPNTKKLNQRFLKYWLIQIESHLALFSSSNTQDNLNASKVRSLPLLAPTLEEQSSIATFLDQETLKIDELLKEQLKLIGLLNEKCQAIISHSITKGINAKASMKPSGSKLLGDIPSHWVVTPLKWLTDPGRPIMYGIVLPGPDVGEGIPILKGGNVKPAKMNLQSMARTTPEIEAPFARARLKEGDLVYSIRGSIGDCELVPPELEGSNITQDVARVAIAEGVCATWARWALLASAIREDLASGSLGAAVRGINIFDLKRASIPTPPPAEQVVIAEFINGEIAKLERLATEAQRAINLMREHRAALISAAVTGKIDVRNVVGEAAAA